MDDSEYCWRIFKRKFNTSFAIIKEDYKDFNKSTKGQICEKSFKTGDVKDHFNGKYPGALHQVCNLILSLTRKLYIVFNNSQNYGPKLIF